MVSMLETGFMISRFIMVLQKPQELIGRNYTIQKFTEIEPIKLWPGLRLLLNFNHLLYLDL